MSAAWTESELISHCLAGESVAWDEFFDRHYTATGQYLYQLSPLLTPADAEELCQETFLAAIRNLRLFRGQAQLRTWLFRIASNKLRDYLAKTQARKRGAGAVPASLDAPDPVTGLTLDPPADLPGPDAALLTAERGRLLHEALERLGNPCREIIELRYFGDLSYEEISAALELNPKTVSSRLSKCLDKLEALARQVFSRENTAGKPV